MHYLHSTSNPQTTPQILKIRPPNFQNSTKIWGFVPPTLKFLKIRPPNFQNPTPRFLKIGSLKGLKIRPLKFLKIRPPNFQNAIPEFSKPPISNVSKSDLSKV